MPGHLTQQHTLNLTGTVEELCQSVLCVGTDCCEYNYSSLGEKWPGRRESIHGPVLQIPSRPRVFCRLTSGEPACPPQAPLLPWSTLLACCSYWEQHSLHISFPEATHPREVKLDSRTPKLEIKEWSQREQRRVTVPAAD